jgi:hypothetical protein
MNIKSSLMAAQEIALCLVRKWWRPMICLGLGGALITNGIAMPLIEGKGADLVGLAALVASVTPFAWLRTQEKAKGLE